MSDHRQVWETLAVLLHRVETSIESHSSAPTIDPSALTGLEQEVRKLGKTQYKANALAEDQAARLDKALAIAQSSQEQQADLINSLAEERCKELLEAILPALDGIENAIQSGKNYLRKRDLAALKSDLTPEQAILVSPADRAMLAGWLEGLRLVQERLLAILEVGQVVPIPTVGQSFDPYRHIAVGTTTRLPDEMPLQSTPDVIVSEERRGYQSPAGVLRFAEVIIYRPPKNEKEL